MSRSITPGLVYLFVYYIFTIFNLNPYEVLIKLEKIKIFLTRRVVLSIGRLLYILNKVIIRSTSLKFINIHRL